MNSFKKLNDITGWIVFAIASIAYILSLEPTASFWDPGEFIAVSYKLQVPHPPGAPLFLLIGRMFSLFAGDVTQVAWWINLSSALFSGATILFLFWSINMLALKLWGIRHEEPETGKKLAIIGAGLVGSLAYAFSDSFWFSAVEAEVYAMSSFFTALVIWIFLKWERIDDEGREQRWLILLAYVVGLSIGVHLLNLVTIPALALLYYFKKKKATNMGVIYTLAVGGIILVIINSFIIPGLPTIAGNFELLFVNTLGLPFGTGTIIFSVLFLGALVYGIRRTYLEGKPLMNTALLCLAFILIGYSSYAIVVIRSNFNHLSTKTTHRISLSFVSYLKREQYGDRPLIYGQFFTADVIDQKQGSPIYYKGDDKYEIAEYRLKNVYDPAESTILPRAYSTSDRHAQIYRQIMGLPEGKSPSFVHNMKFMFRHQINHMYWRYFMWNFSGRESDIQDAGWLGFWHSSSGLPEVLKNNKARNNYFMFAAFSGNFRIILSVPKRFPIVFLCHDALPHDGIGVGTLPEFPAG
jgi:hypothetical protein